MACLAAVVVVTCASGFALGCRSGELPSSLTVLRTCLAFEARRLHFVTYDETTRSVPTLLS